MSGGSSRGRYGNRMSVWKGLVCPHIAAHLFIGAAFSESDALHHQLATMFQTRDLKIESLIGQQLLLKRKLRVDGLFATAL